MMPEEESEYDPATVAIQIQQFLDDWHYHIIASLSGSWNRPKATMAALTLFEYQGVVFEAGEKEAVVQMDDTSMIQRLISKMPMELIKNFEQFALQLKVIITTATNVRKVVDQGCPEDIQQIMDHGDSTGIVSQILKRSILRAGNEVAEIRNRHESWTTDTDKRMVRLVRSADDAVQVQNELNKLQMQINGFGSAQNEKSKRMMAGVAGKNDKVLVGVVFASWQAFQQKMKSEKGIRDMFEAEIESLETKLMEYRQAALNNVRNVLMRKAAEGDSALLTQVWKSWADEVQETKREAGSQAAMQAMEAKLASASAAQTENTKKVMARMSAGSDNALLSLCVSSWVTWLADYKKDKETEDAVKAQEQQFQEYLAKKKEGAKAVLDKMNSATDSGLVEHVISTWCQAYKDNIEAKKMEEIMAANEAKFGALNGRQKDNAKGVMGRVNEQMELNCLLRHFSMWALDAKMERTMRYYNSKMENKKQQLHSVQHLFKNFATQLDQGLKGEGDSARASGNRSKAKDEFSLPDIPKK